MELNQTSICYYDRRLQRTAMSTESADAIVPDTYPDVGRVVCAYGIASVKDQTPQNGRLLISGMVRTTVVYLPEEGGGLRLLNIPISFAHIEECEALNTDAVCLAACRVASVEAVAVNSRKLTVNATLCFESEGYQKTSCSLTESIDLPQAELRRTPCLVTLIEQAQSCPITVLEDVTIPDAAGLSLLHADCVLRATECRAMQGKAVLKGEASITCLALQEDDAVRVLTSATPFTQILEMPEIGEGDMLTASLTAKELDCRLEPDGLLSYTVNAAALLLMRRAQTLQNIDDLYIPGKELQLTQEKTMLRSTPPASAFAGETTETLQTARHVSHIVFAGAFSCDAKRADGEKAQLTAAVQVLYLDDDQQLCFLQRMLPVSVPCSGQGELSQLELVARGAPSGEQGIMLTLSVKGCIAAEEQCTFRCITELSEIDAPCAANGVTLKLRYIDREQPLWDIAKACGTTMEAIRRANELPADVQTAADTMLLIPIGG